MFVKSVADTANKIKDLSEQFNVTTDEVQRLQKAASEAGGVGFEALSAALTKLGNARQDASTNNDALLKTFNKYGISLAQLQNPQLRNIDLMYQLAAAMKNLSETDRQDLVDLFGKSGGRILETLKAIDEQGPIELIKKDDIDAIDRASEAIDELARRAKVAAAGPLVAFGQRLANIFSHPAPQLNLSDEEKTMRDSFKGSGYLKFGKDDIGLGLVEDLIQSRMRGSEKEQSDQLDILRAYYKSKNPTESGISVGGFQGPMQPALNEMTPATAAKLREEREKLEKQLAEAAVKYRLAEADSEYKKREILEKKLLEHSRNAQAQRAILDPEHGEFVSPQARAEAMNAALTEELAAAGILTQIAGLKGGSNLDVASITQSGMFGTGRNAIVSQAENATVQEIRKLLGFNKDTAQNTKEIATAFKNSPPLRVSR
jgi:hypothetical protein